MTLGMLWISNTCPDLESAHAIWSLQCELLTSTPIFFSPEQFLCHRLPIVFVRNPYAANIFLLQLCGFFCPSFLCVVQCEVKYMLVSASKWWFSEIFFPFSNNSFSSLPPRPTVLVNVDVRLGGLLLRPSFSWTLPRTTCSLVCPFSCCLHSMRGYSWHRFYYQNDISQAIQWFGVELEP